MIELKDMKLYLIKLVGGDTEELGRYYENPVSLDRPAFELRFPSRLVTVDEVEVIREADEKELD